MAKKLIRNLFRKFEIRRRPPSHLVRNGIVGLLAVAGIGYAIKRMMNPETRRQVRDKVSSVLHRAGQGGDTVASSARAM